MRLKTSLVILAVCFSLAVGLLPFPAPCHAQPDYILSPEDELSITVWDHPDLTRKTRVSLEGKISFPLIGEVEVAGLTPLQAEKKIKGLLDGDYVVNPQVSIQMEEYKTARMMFYVTGEVTKPGQYPYQKGMSLLHAISSAGGFTEKAARSKVRVVREVEGKKIELKFGLDQAIEPGDTVVVPESFW